MKKETLTVEAIKSDLIKIAKAQMGNKADWRFSYITPITVLAVLLSILTKHIWIGVAVFSFAVYHIVRFALEYRAYRAKKAEILSVIERGEISISKEVFSHVATDVIYEPHHGGRHTNTTKTVTRYHFDGGSSWRVPLFAKHYAWSREHNVSAKGLYNISIKGDEFYVVSLQTCHDIAYIYPCKCFELDHSLHGS